MEKKTLKQYRALKREISLLDKAIDRLYCQLDNVPTLHGKVTGSMDEFPYIPVHVSVEMADPAAADRIRALIRKREQQRDQANRTLEEIVSFISRIPDSTDRQIFEMVYIDGMTYRDVGDALSLHYSSVAKRIESKLSTNSTN